MPSLTRHVSTIHKRIMHFNRMLRIVKRIVLLFFGSTILTVLGYRWLPVPYTPLMLIRSIEHWTDKPSYPRQHDWVSLDEISPHMPVAVIASEDQLFMQHNGFDLKAIQKATEEADKGKRLRGASTISQQTAKNVFLWNGRSWLRKGLEVYFTVCIECLWSKERIMEVYLNSIEMGKGIYGIEAVAQANFRCHASELTAEQCALIAATLPNPLTRDSKHPTSYLRKRQRQILRQMRNVGSAWKNRH